jgi:hypothetical protein
MPIIFITLGGMILLSFLNSILGQIIKKKIKTILFLNTIKKECGPLHLGHSIENINQNTPRKDTRINWVNLRKQILIIVRSAEYLQNHLVSVSTSWIYADKYYFYRPLQLVLCHFTEDELEERYMWDELFRERVDLLIKKVCR